MVALGALLLALDLADGTLDESYGGASGSIFGSALPIVVIVLFSVLGTIEFRRVRAR